MSEETEVTIVCDDCGGNLTNAGGTIDDLFSMALGEDRPHYWHMEQSGCIASLNERLTAATERAEFWNNAHRADLMEADVKHRELRERAEAAEAERDVSATAHRIACGALAESWERRRELRAEREALRTERDAWEGTADKAIRGNGSLLQEREALRRTLSSAQMEAEAEHRACERVIAERDALRYSNAMLSRIVQDQLADLGLKGIGDHMSQYLLPDDECDKCGVLRTVDDAMVERAARATMNRVYKDNDLFADDEELLRIHREYARIAITAALAVQP